MGNIVWLASYPRSGNTWLRLFLYRIIKGPLPDDKFPPLELFAPNEVNALFYAPVIGKSLDDASIEELAQARMEAQKLAASASDGPLFVKTHHQAGYHLQSPTLNLGVTSAAIYIVRNPLDVADSLCAFLRISAEECIEIMRPNSNYLFRPPGCSYYFIGSWSDHVRSWTTSPSRHRHIVRYEDMIADPLKVFGSILRFLHIKRSDEEVIAALDDVELAKLRNREKQQGFSEVTGVGSRYFRKGKIGSGRTNFDGSQIEHLVRNSQDILQKFAYD